MSSDEESLLQLLRCLDSLFAAGTVPSTLLLLQENPQWGPHEKITGLCRALQAIEYIVLTLKEKTLFILTQEGEEYAEKGTPEANLVKWMQENPNEEGYELNDLKKKLGFRVELGFTNALKMNWCIIDKNTKKIKINPNYINPNNINPNNNNNNIIIKDIIKDTLHAIKDWGFLYNNKEENKEKELMQTLANINNTQTPEKIIQDLKRRKLIEQRKIKYNIIKKGNKFSLFISKPLADIDAKLIANDQWKEKELKPYNFFASGKRLRRGAPHPLMLVQKQFKHILTTMGFEEMDTNQYVDPSFWCFDALYMPQQHPARDAQDTFFIQNPENANASLLPQQFVSAVKQMHEKGGCGSTGWGYTWSLEESLKNVMRTHTTSVSARCLYQIAQEYKKTGQFRPRKLFSIDRVFRNENLDATHLAEFHQVEGVVAGTNLSLGHLMGVMETFYKAIGIQQLKFKPTFNPYTEPSMEIFGFHPGLKRWIEVGNSGIFRPEMTRPMDLPSSVSVIAWGLSLERPTMIKYGISNIRELFGPKALLGGV